MHQKHGPSSTPIAYLLNYRVILSKESTLFEDNFGITKNPEAYSSPSPSPIVFGDFEDTVVFGVSMGWRWGKGMVLCAFIFKIPSNE